MTDQQHPITPPPELATHWLELWNNMPVPRPVTIQYIATQAAQWGADQELEACCAEVSYWASTAVAAEVRAARRPPPSLKEEALEALEHLALGPDPTAFLADMETIRRALEALPNDH
jgi:hypothetical protein